MTPAKTQPTQNERVCLKCGTDGSRVAVYIEYANDKEASIHNIASLADDRPVYNDDVMDCLECDYRTTGRNFSATLAKRRKAANATGHGVPTDVVEKIQEQIDYEDKLTVGAHNDSVDTTGLEPTFPRRTNDSHGKAPNHRCRKRQQKLARRKNRR